VAVVVAKKIRVAVGTGSRVEEAMMSGVSAAREV
jgi:hypothetical protein